MNRDQFRMDLWAKVYAKAVFIDSADPIWMANNAVDAFNARFNDKAPETELVSHASLIDKFKAMS